MLRKFIPFALILIIAASCKEEEQVDYGPIDKKIIEDYLNTNNLTAQSTASGLYYIIQTPGGANHPEVKSSVLVNYTGYLTDGTVFDSSYPTGKPYASPLKSLVAGWQEGLPMIGTGGKIQLFIPSELGYGSAAKSLIPANSVLIFDIELVDYY